LGLETDLHRYQTRYRSPTRAQFSRAHLDWEMSVVASRRLPLILGVTGPAKSGKTTVAQHLVAWKGFLYENLGNILRDNATRLGIVDPDWKDLARLAETWRSVDGNEILARELVSRLRLLGPDLRRDIVIDGILHEAEAEHLRQLSNFRLLAIVASQRDRYARHRMQSAPPEAMSRRRFRERDAYERGCSDQRSEHAACVDRVVKSVPPLFRLKNDGNEADLLTKVNEAFPALVSELPRYVGFCREA